VTSGHRNGLYDDERDIGPCELYDRRKGYPIPAVEKASSPIASHVCETGQPQWGLTVVDLVSKLIVREAEFLSGRRKDQKAKAASRKAKEIHNWADRAGNGDTHAEKRLT
jgi:hypothetical protein